MQTALRKVSRLALPATVPVTYSGQVKGAEPPKFVEAGWPKKRKKGQMQAKQVTGGGRCNLAPA